MRLRSEPWFRRVGQWAVPHYCPACGSVEVWDNAEGFLEQGMASRGREQASCPICGEDVVPPVVGRRPGRFMHRHLGLRLSRSIRRAIVRQLLHAKHSKGTRDASVY